MNFKVTVSSKKIFVTVFFSQNVLKSTKESNAKQRIQNNKKNYEMKIFPIILT